MTEAKSKSKANNGKPPLWRRLSVLLPSLLVVAIGVAGVGVVATVVPKREEGELTVSRPPEPVRVVEIAPVPQLPDTFLLNGVIEPEAVVRIAAEVAGRVERLGTPARPELARDPNRIDEGDPIEAGQVLMELNKELIQTEYDQAQAQYRLAQAEFERVSETFRQGAASELELDNARTAVLVARAALDSAAARLERTTITSPIDGVLNHLPVEVGEYVTAGTPVAEIVNNRQAKVVVDVPERIIPYLRVGQEQQIYTMGRTERTITGRITFISELADPAARTTRIEITVPNTAAAAEGASPAVSTRSWERDRLFRSGQIVKVRLTKQVLENVILIPLASAIPTETGYVVYTVAGADVPDTAVARTLPADPNHALSEGADGIARVQDISIGLIKGTQVQVTKGLRPGDLLIFDGQRKVGPGQRVRIIQRRTGTVDPGASAVDAQGVPLKPDLAGPEE